MVAVAEASRRSRLGPVGGRMSPDQGTHRELGDPRQTGGTLPARNIFLRKGDHGPGMRFLQESTSAAGRTRTQGRTHQWDWAPKITETVEDFPAGALLNLETMVMNLIPHTIRVRGIRDFAKTSEITAAPLTGASMQWRVPSIGWQSK